MNVELGDMIMFISMCVKITFTRKEEKSKSGIYLTVLVEIYCTFLMWYYLAFSFYTVELFKGKLKINHGWIYHSDPFKLKEFM